MLFAHLLLILLIDFFYNPTLLHQKLKNGFSLLLKLQLVGELLPLR